MCFMGMVRDMNPYKCVIPVLCLTLVFCSSLSIASKWPSEDCGEYIETSIDKVDQAIVRAVTEKNGLIDAEYEISKEECKDGYLISFTAKGKYKNPGFHWLVVVSNKEGIVEIVGGL